MNHSASSPFIDCNLDAIYHVQENTQSELESIECEQGVPSPMERALHGLSRRRTVALAFSAFAGLFLPSEEVHANLFDWMKNNEKKPTGSTSSRQPVVRTQPSRSTGSLPRPKPLPAEWMARPDAALIRQYATVVYRLRLKHITPEQVVGAHFKSHGSVVNSLPPKQMWTSICPTLLALDMVAGQVREPVGVILSAYRTPAYNRVCGGKSKSYHMVNMATDIRFTKASPSTVASVARNLRSRGYFSGGVGRYSSFVHIDCRGENFDW